VRICAVGLSVQLRCVWPACFRQKLSWCEQRLMFCTTAVMSISKKTGDCFVANYMNCCCKTVCMPEQSVLVQAVVTIEASRSYSDTPHAVRLLWTKDQSDSVKTCTTHNAHNRQTSIPLAGFEPTNPPKERPQTHGLDRAATGIGICETLWALQLICDLLFGSAGSCVMM
jgi:hypothetical protein